MSTVERSKIEPQCENVEVFLYCQTMISYLTSEIRFPNVHQANTDGLLAVGDDLSTERLILAYKKGIFPWFEKNQPILWWSPNPRFVLFPEKLKVSKSMKQVLKNNNFTITINQDFKAVITECAKTKRTGQRGTWITHSMIEAYMKLHKVGVAKSVEVWQYGNLVAGFYGVDLNNGVFCGESMFTKVSNASKAGFISFIQNTNYNLVDCQVFKNL